VKTWSHDPNKTSQNKSVQRFICKQITSHSLEIRSRVSILTEGMPRPKKKSAADWPSDSLVYFCSGASLTQSWSQVTHPRGREYPAVALPAQRKQENELAPSHTHTQQIPSRQEGPLANKNAH